MFGYLCVSVCWKSHTESCLACIFQPDGLQQAIRTHQTYCSQVEPRVDRPNLKFLRFPECSLSVLAHLSPFCIRCTRACPCLGNLTLGRRPGAHHRCLLSTQFGRLKITAAKPKQNIWPTRVSRRKDFSLYIRDRL